MAKNVTASEYFHSSIRNGCVLKLGSSVQSMLCFNSCIPFSNCSVNTKYRHTSRTILDYASSRFSVSTLYCTPCCVAFVMIR